MRHRVKPHFARDEPVTVGLSPAADATGSTQAKPAGEFHRRRARFGAVARRGSGCCACAARQRGRFRRAPQSASLGPTMRVLLLLGRRDETS